MPVKKVIKRAKRKTYRKKKKNQYPGYCLHCNVWIPKGKGYFEWVMGDWKVIHARCRTELNTPKATEPWPTTRFQKPPEVWEFRGSSLSELPESKE